MKLHKTIRGRIYAIEFDDESKQEEINIALVTKELARLSCENRKLREENKQLKEKLKVMTKRKDRLMDNLKCTLDEIDDEN